MGQLVFVCIPFQYALSQDDANMGNVAYKFSLVGNSHQGNLELSAAIFTILLGAFELLVGFEKIKSPLFGTCVVSACVHVVCWILSLAGICVESAPWQLYVSGVLGVLGNVVLIAGCGLKFKVSREEDQGEFDFWVLHVH